MTYRHGLRSPALRRYDVDFEALSARITKCEEDIKNLYSKTNKAEVNQARITEKLDNVLIELGRVREAIDPLKTRPAKMWDKLIYGIIGAAAAALVSIIINGGI